ncbi:MAG: hypothetical protein ACLFP8_05280 [Alphaproteobacteria bacterium]
MISKALAEEGTYGRNSHLDADDVPYCDGVLDCIETVAKNMYNNL